MSNIYEWLFDHYALPKLRCFESNYNDVLAAFAERTSLTKKEHLRLHDMISNMRLEWGVEVFTMGVRFGLRLNQPNTRRRELGWLMDFLP